MEDALEYVFRSSDRNHRTFLDDVKERKRAEESAGPGTDIAALPNAQAGSLLRDRFGVPSEQVSKLGRWQRIRLLHQLCQDERYRDVVAAHPMLGEYAKQSLAQVPASKATVHLSNGITLGDGLVRTTGAALEERWLAVCSDISRQQDRVLKSNTATTSGTPEQQQQHQHHSNHHSSSNHGRLGPPRVQIDPASCTPLMLHGVAVDGLTDLALESAGGFSSARANVCVYAGRWQYEVTLRSPGLQQLVRWARVCCCCSAPAAAAADTSPGRSPCMYLVCTHAWRHAWSW